MPEPTPPSRPADAILLATRSRDKLREIRAILGERLAARLITLDDAGIAVDPAEDAIECFDTFRENALAKARYFADRAGMPTLADDSGLTVDALGGEPGVRSKRFSGRPLHGVELDRANNAELLRRLTDVPRERRTARYVCAAALHEPGGLSLCAVGTCAGIILEAPHGDSGFGYDPLFFVPELDRTFGEVAATEKNRRSHRARAFRALAQDLPG